LVPNLPEDVQKKIAKLYYEEKGNLGTSQLNEQRLTTLNQLNSLLDKIINENEVSNHSHRPDLGSPN